MDANADGTSNSTQPESIFREGQLPQLQLNAMSQQRDDSMGPIGVLRDQQEGTVPGFSSGVRARTVSLQGSVSCEGPGPVPSAGDGGGVLSISEYGRPSPLEQPHNVLPNYSQLPPPLRDPVLFAGPNAPPLRQYPGYGGPVSEHPGYQQFTPFQGQGQLLGQPPFHRWDQSGQLINPPVPPQFPLSFPFPPPRHPAPFFDRFHDRMGQTVGFARRNSVPLSAGGDMGPGARQRLQGWPYPATFQPPRMYPPARPQVYPQMPFQMNPQVPPRMNPWIPPEMQMRGPMPTNRSVPPGPRPPHPGPSLAPREPIPVTNRAGPSTSRRRTSRTSRTSAVLQPRRLSSDPNDVPENDGTGLDFRRGTTGRARTRPNLPRKTRPTKRNKRD